MGGDSCGQGEGLIRVVGGGLDGAEGSAVELQLDASGLGGDDEDGLDAAMAEGGFAEACAGGDGVDDTAADGERGGDVVEIAVVPAPEVKAESSLQA